eukprot:3534007-Alexandrium_andersonii.AAC.1
MLGDDDNLDGETLSPDGQSVAEMQCWIMAHGTTDNDSNKRRKQDSEGDSSDAYDFEYDELAAKFEAFCVNHNISPGSMTLLEYLEIEGPPAPYSKSKSAAALMPPPPVPARAAAAAAAQRPRVVAIAPPPPPPLPAPQPAAIQVAAPPPPAPPASATPATTSTPAT